MQPARGGPPWGAPAAWAMMAASLLTSSSTTVLIGGCGATVSETLLTVFVSRLSVSNTDRVQVPCMPTPSKNERPVSPAVPK